jgi:hypothetical protein
MLTGNEVRAPIEGSPLILIDLIASAIMIGQPRQFTNSMVPLIMPVSIQHMTPPTSEWRLFIYAVLVKEQ